MPTELGSHPKKHGRLPKRHPQNNGRNVLSSMGSLKGFFWD